MHKIVKSRISLPDRIKNPAHYEEVIEVNGEKQTILNGEPEYLSIKDKNERELEKAFAKIKFKAFSDQQLKSINDFLLENYRRLCKLRLYEGSQYCYWKVYKRCDDILFRIYEVVISTSGDDYTGDDQKYLFPFLGGVIEVSEQIKFNPEEFGFEYQFNLYNQKKPDE